MKKMALWLFVAVFLLSILVGCAGGQSAPKGTAAEIANKVFAASGVENFGMSQNLKTAEDKEYYLGSTDYPAFSEAIAVTPLINLDTRVLVIIKAADQRKVEDIKTRLRENIDPNRIVCVTFSLEDVAIESRGEVILLTINTDAEQRTAMIEAFKSIDK
jgi:hypothetical protein